MAPELNTVFDTTLDTETDLKPTPPVLFDRAKLMRWLSPVLLVSLALHGVSLLVPIPQTPEVIEEPEPEVLEPIQISTLPVDLDDLEPEPLSASPPPEPAPVTPPPEPLPAQPPIELPPEPELLLEPEPPAESEAPIEQETPPEQDTPAEEETPVEQDPPAEQDPPPAGDYDPDVAGNRDLSGYQAFVELTSRYDSELVATPLNNDTLSLQYTGSRCYQDLDTLSGAIGVVMENTQALLAGQITGKTGSKTMDASIDRWFQEQIGNTPGEPSELQIAGDSLYGWLFNATDGDWFDGKTYEAYWFPIEIELVNNPC
mgnify:CR=1 FL=1